jgi:hypothetical protein
VLTETKKVLKKSLRKKLGKNKNKISPLPWELVAVAGELIRGCDA